VVIEDSIYSVIYVNENIGISFSVRIKKFREDCSTADSNSQSKSNHHDQTLTVFEWESKTDFTGELDSQHLRHGPPDGGWLTPV
jgi:hypothetical protein